MSKRLLVLSASVGAGHLRAAQAVEQALREVDPSATVENHDILQFTNAAFRRIYAQFYLDLVNKAPHVLGYFYDLLDKPVKQRQLSEQLRRLIQDLNLRKFVSFLKEKPWDLVVNTHFLPAEIIAILRRKKKLNQPQFTVSTDFETHRLWVNQPCDRYFTATEEGAVNLAAWGIPAEDIVTTGIPIHPDFSRLLTREEARARHGIPGDRPVILQLAGGFGVGPIEELFDAVLACELPLDCIIVTGKNEKLRQKLAKRNKHPRHRVQVLGFTREMHELLVAADAVITKPGGLTTSEALACGTPLVVVNPIPGQESRNSDFLLENGAAIKVNNLATLTYKLSRLLHDPVRLANMRERARSLGKPQAAFVITRQALDYVSETRSPHQ
ncbi:MAG TPA: glycosyltransferase [Gemmatales bacterium]|nr:glycosyltransferase [Gemmatales bacterium]